MAETHTPVHDSNRREAFASCRLTRVERALVEAAAAQEGDRFVSDWLRAVVRDRLRDTFGAAAVRDEAPTLGSDRDGATRSISPVVR